MRHFIKMFSRAGFAGAVVTAVGLAGPVAAAPFGMAPGSTGPGELVSTSALSATDLWAVGDTGTRPSKTLAMHWDGHTWATVPTRNVGHSSSLTAVVTISHDDVWAVGQRFNRQAFGPAMSEHWDGTRWTLVPLPKLPPHTFAATLDGLSATASDDVWAVGFRETIHFTYVALAEHWDGTTWSIVPSWTDPQLGSTLASVSALGPKDVWAVGESGDFPSRTLVEHWDGTSWQPVASPNPGGQMQFNSLGGVHVLSASDVWAVGDYTTPKSDGETLALHWDGTAWSEVGTVNPPGSSDGLDAVDSTSPTDVWAVGSTGGAALVEHWNGSSWSRVSTPDPRYRFLVGVAALGPRNAWTVGADFGTKDVQTVIEHWNGDSWTVR